MIGGDGINDESNKTAPAPCERVDVFHVSDDWIGYNVSDWFMRDMTTKELIIMADPNRPRHYEEEFKRQIVQS